ncbi:MULTISPECIES: hypothetical protein [Pseudomonas]|uniref:Fido domain-containing protein n=1 Tax=Pseudomonas putida TaxID=303 RepID=A0AAD0PDZ3_PSEPU|nr:MULTISPECIES: hypothetical protein [Pseudomonas]ANC03010.1 hypothetical protein AB688_13100 [Pseudomonas putida]AXA24666.1 hypothetical protein C1S65_11295 [Pseudomonas putida]KAB5625155.1 hypothetical protein F7234_04970 [Pseudomonas putida]MBH3458237.1 hypothetical protein [Pseudomonas putida]MBK0057548.1 hypothetical protein [Pseudomonas sp. S44]
MRATRRLDLSAVERALRDVQRRFTELSKHFTEPRDPFTDEVLQNVLEGYALIDDYVARGIDLFDLQQLNLMLEINATVLCGSDPERRVEFAQHLIATEEHFFNNVEGGIKDLYNWYCSYGSDSVWKRAAGVYVRILSKPQLFIEGNNRTGSLIVSYLLMRAGLPPFVLTLDNAEGYFNPSSVIRNSAKHGVKALYELPKIKKKYAAFLEAQSPDPEKFFLGEAATPAYREVR